LLHAMGAEVLKARRRGALGLVMALWIALSLLFTYLLPDLRARGGAVPPGLLPAHLATTAISGYSFWGGTLVLILSALWTGSEFGWGTWKTLFTVRSSRASVLGAQLATLASALALLVVLAYACAYLASLTVASTHHVASAPPPLGPTARSMAVAWLLVVMWGTIGSALAMLTQGTALAIGLGIVWSLAVENLVRAFTGAIPFLASLDRLFPGANGESAIAAIGGGGATASVSADRAFLTVAAYVVAAAAAMLLAGTGRDVV
jgi:ABC-2 type transport system permease protein